MSSKSASPWISIKLGRELNGISIDVPTCPNSNAKIHEKARAFDAVTQAISAHLDVFDFAELKNCLTTHVPGSHAFSSNQVQSLDLTLAKAPFEVQNLKPIGFLFADKSPVDPGIAQSPAAQRPANIRYFRVSFQVDPKSFAPPGTSLKELDPFVAEYDLPLFQTPIQQVGGLPRLNIWPNNTPGPQQTPHTGPPAAQTVPSLLGHTMQSVAHYALPTVFAAPTPLPPMPVETPQTYGPLPESARGPTRGRTPPSTIINTYVGNTEFLTNQAVLDEFCSCKPTFHPHVATGWTAFCKRVKWTIFTQLVRIAYVGNLDTDCNQAISDIAAEFRRLHMVDGKPKTNSEFDNPNELFDAYVERLPSLPNDVQTWGFCLPHLYHGALSEQCREHLIDYKPPNVSQLTSKNAQYEALTQLRTAAGTAFSTISRNQTSMKRFFAQHLNGSTLKAFTTSVAEAVSPARKSPERKKGRNVSWGDDVTSSSSSSSSSSQISSYAFHSPAEQTLRAHKPTDSTDIKEFPTDPFTGYTSKYYRGQKVCFGCGECDPSKHVEFKLCPKKHEEATKQAFFKELHAHSKTCREKHQLKQYERRTNSDKPNSDKAKQSTPTSTTTTPPAAQTAPYQAQLMPPPRTYTTHTYQEPVYTQTSTYAMLPPQVPYTPVPPPAPVNLPPPPHPYSQASTSQPVPPAPTPAPAPAPAQSAPQANASFFPVRVRSFHTQPSPNHAPPMPLNIDMGLPNITWDLGLPNDPNPVKLRALFDSCGCCNVGRLDYHLWLVSQRPDIVAEFRFFDGHQPFDPLGLDGVVSQSSDLVSTDDGLLSERHGLLTAIVRYWTPYKMPNGSPLAISFGLGEHVSTNTLTGLPTLEGLKFITDYSKFQAYSATLDRHFPLDRYPGDCGLPNGTTFDIAEFRKQHDQDLATHRSTDSRSLATADRTHAQAFYSPSLLAAVDDPTTNFLRRKVIPAPGASQQ